MKQNKAKIIGLTGGIASGKTTVTKFLKKYNYKVIDSDNLAREVVEKNKPAYKEIINEFGKDILDKKYQIDRKKLARIIFEDIELREKLNKIVHPKIYDRIKAEIKKNEGQEDVLFIDMPLLIEVRDDLKKENIIFNEIWLIYAEKAQQIERLIKRNNYSKEEAEKRINSQIDIDEKIKYCDKIIDNSKEIKYTKEQIKKELNIN